MKRCLVLGAGGREHALAWALSRSALRCEVHVAPGNAGIARGLTCHDINPSDGSTVVDLARQLDVHLVVIGPEAPLVDGVADQLRDAGIPVFGPSAAAARLEGSKGFAKEILDAAGAPTAAWTMVNDPEHLHRWLAQQDEAPWVVKADGLAAGKGVVLCADSSQVGPAAQQLWGLGGEATQGGLLIEETLVGREVSLFVLTDGERYRCFPALRDHKRVGEGDTGPNTGGMGAYQPVADWNPELQGRVADEIIEPVLGEMRRRGTPFAGLLYCGLMLTSQGPKVLEFNVRFGDPETQPLMAALDEDLYDLLYGAATGALGRGPIKVRGASCCVVLANEGYPGSGQRGQIIHGIHDAETMDDVVVFHAGTAAGPDSLTAAGGRVLGVTGVGEDLDAARERAYRAVAALSWNGMHYRGDIAASEATR